MPMSPAQAELLRLQKKAGKTTRLKLLRISRDLSQSELASLSGIPKNTLVKYEQGTSSIENAKFSMILKICDTLQCSIADILEDDTLYNKVK